MPDDPTNEQSPAPRPTRQRMLTPEQRRFLGTPRARDPEPPPPSSPEPVEPPPQREARTSRSERPPERRQAPPEPVEPAGEWEEERGPSAEPGKRTSGGLLRLDQTASRTSEMQRAFLIIGVLVVLGLTFLVGMKFPYLKYKFLTSRQAPKLEGTVANKFPGVATEDLIEQGLQLEREGKLQDAAERYLAAKHKDLAYRGILARVGKIAYDNKDLAMADQLFERAIAFDEDVETSNYYRGLIAVRRKDVPGALRSFEAAMVAAPFVALYPYFLGEALRLDHHPREAIPRYEHAILLSNDVDEARICRFKIRMALLEAAEATPVKEELEAKKAAGKLAVDWMLTAAAIDLREGRLDEAIPLLLLARDAGEPVVFASCITDAYFVEAAHKHPRVAEVSRVPAG